MPFVVTVDVMLLTLNEMTTYKLYGIIQDGADGDDAEYEVTLDISIN